MKNGIIYVAKDGTKFEDEHEVIKHNWELHIQELEAINKKSWLDAGLPWFVLATFLGGYLFGWFCNFTS